MPGSAASPRPTGRGVGGEERGPWRELAADRAARRTLIIDRTLGDGQFRGVLLAGAPGVGKTRLAREALTAAEAAGCFTRWAAASRALAAIPFGALADLLPLTGDNSTHLQVLQQAGKWMAAQAGGPRVVLGVDDAHMLDDASAALLFHLVVNGIAFVVATLPHRGVRAWAGHGAVEGGRGRAVGDSGAGPRRGRRADRGRTGCSGRRTDQGAAVAAQPRQHSLSAGAGPGRTPDRRPGLRRRACGAGPDRSALRLSWPS